MALSFPTQEEIEQAAAALHGLIDHNKGESALLEDFNRELSDAEVAVINKVRSDFTSEQEDAFNDNFISLSNKNNMRPLIMAKAKAESIKRMKRLTKCFFIGAFYGAISGIVIGAATRIAIDYVSNE